MWLRAQQVKLVFFAPVRAQAGVMQAPLARFRRRKVKFHEVSVKYISW